MGGVYSSLLGAVKTIKAVVSILRSLSADFSGILARANAPPGLPVPHPTAPYWLEDPPYPELVDIQSPQLPRDADVAIVGSGIAAAATARAILHEARRKGSLLPRVVVLEARALCSGATGRNGGHIKASPHDLFGRLRRRVGPERAAALLRFQLRHLGVLTGLCEAEGIAVAECRAVETVDLFADEEQFHKVVEGLEELQKWLPEFEVQVWEGLALKEKFHTNDLVVGAISYKAGALWPYRFVVSIWKGLLDQFASSLAIETSTPVKTVEVGSSQSHPYKLATSRGVINARHVVHATNAFSGQLLPVLRGKMVGAVAHMSSQRPGKDFPDLNGSRSWSVMYGRGFDYVTQRPSVEGVPGDVMLGGGFAQSQKQGVEQIGVYDDSKLDVLTVAHILGTMPTIFDPRWGEEAPGGKGRRVWSGIISLTSDFYPLVGWLDPRLTERKVERSMGGTSKRSDQPAEWIAAGFCGDGMVWAWLSGTALGVMIMGGERDEVPEAPGRPGGRVVDWFPADLLPAYERVKGMDIADLVDELT